MKVYQGTVTPNEMDWEVTVDGRPLSPRYDLANHSPDGFSWGYAGSGPAQLALALLADYLGDKEAQRLYQDFKFVIARLPQNECWKMTGGEIESALLRMRS
jgi:hypothetical protein